MVSLGSNRLAVALFFILGVLVTFLMFMDVDKNDYDPLEAEIFAFLQEGSKVRTQFHYASTCGGVSNCTTCLNNTCQDSTIVDSTISGDDSISNALSYTGAVTYATAGTSTFNADVTYASTSVVVINAARVFTGTGAISYADGATVTFNALVTFSNTGAVTFGKVVVFLDTFGVIFAGRSVDMLATTLNFTNAAAAQFRTLNNTLSNCTLSGSTGTAHVNAAGAVLYSIFDTFGVPLTLNSTTTARRTSFTRSASMRACGGSYGATTVASRSAIIADTSCTAASNTSYSSTFDSVTTVAGSYLQFDKITSTSKAVYLNAATVADFTIFEAISNGAGAYTVHLATYPKSTTCLTSFTSAIDGCPTGYTCTTTGAQDASNSNLCHITYSQALTTSNDDDSNEAYYAFFAFLALPLACLLGLVLMKVCSKKKATAAVAAPAYPVINSYPEAPYPEVGMGPVPMVPNSTPIVYPEI